MQRNKFIVDIIAIGFLVTFLHAGAIESSWYWSYWSTDIIMHFLGGLFVGLVAVWVVSEFIDLSKKQILFFTLLATFLIGVGWELFEYITGAFVAEDPFPDTIYDLVLDTVGALAAYMYADSQDIVLVSTKS